MLPVTLLVAWLLPPGTAAAQAVVQAQDRTQVLDCHGGDARVEGNRNVLVFRGACRTLRVFGEENRVTAQVVPGAEIEVQGQRNRVSYVLAGGTEPPRVSVAGLDDSVGPGAMPAEAAVPVPGVAPANPKPPRSAALPPTAPVPAALPAPAPTSAGPLVLRGDDQERAEDCAGGDAVIEGHRGSYVLRGSCRSLTVRGDLIVVQVELAPRSHVVIDGSGTAVHWVLAGKGVLPSVTIRGDGSRALRASGLLP